VTNLGLLFQLWPASQHGVYSMHITLLRKIEECTVKQQLENEKEERIQKALQAIAAESFKTKFKTIFAVARHFNVSHYILSHRKLGCNGP
jgi:hypothetical protein